ncbi:hypothetical protein [Lyngbya sp. PCC 8106]|uniref:hypothetical protein n=1 Tax=Lyngbya sp. (strain PCC 8106) TaxID=313612 RepID=UPI0000EAC2A6|nr:hypothetical protein [Lyngbya sp. PCC 8106]EAW38514.1 hypothetical protein L8106_06924 [Lyngbya sp. PCC 8106]
MILTTLKRPILHLHSLLIRCSANSRSSSTKFWLSLSLTFATIYSLLAVQEAFSGEYVIQDDARQHIFWMQRFLDAELFPNDLIADYFQSVAPGGYQSLYWILTRFGINPIFWSKILPWGLDIVTTFYCFRITLELLPIPLAGFISSTLLNQQLWLNDGLVSATPRAFVYPLFLGFIYFLLRKSILKSAIFIALIGLFYPQAVLISVGVLILQLFNRNKHSVCLTSDLKNRWVSMIGLGVASIVILYYAMSSSEFSPVITVAEAKAMSEFGGAGNSAFFQDNLWDFWVTGQRSGLLPKYLFRPTLIITGLGLPLLFFYKNQFPLVSKITPNIKIFSLVLISSMSWFIAAHLMLFKLHLPSRYTSYTFRVCLALSAGITLCILLDKVLIFASLSRRQNWKQIMALSLTLFLGLGVILGSCFWGKFPKTSYVMGKEPEIYHFFSQQPKDTLIASISEVANNIPSFSQRSVWIAWEYAVPYHLGYYDQIQQRATELIKAQYSSNLTVLQTLIQTHGFDFIILDQTAFTPEYMLENRWLRQWYHSLSKDIFADINTGKNPAILQTVSQCSRLQTQKIIILEAECLVKF